MHNVEKVGSSVPLRKLLCKFRQNVSLLQMHTDSWNGTGIPRLVRFQLVQFFDLVRFTNSTK